MDLTSNKGLQDPFYPKSAIVVAIEEIEQRICCIEENCCDEGGDGILKTDTSGPNYTKIWSSVVNTHPVGERNIIIGSKSDKSQERREKGGKKSNPQRKERKKKEARKTLI